MQRLSDMSEHGSDVTLMLDEAVSVMHGARIQFGRIRVVGLRQPHLKWH